MNKKCESSTITHSRDQKLALQIASSGTLISGGFLAIGALFFDSQVNMDVLSAGAGFLTGGGILRYFYLKENKKYQELRLIEFVINSYGKTTVPELALALKKTDAKKQLGRMVDEGVFYLSVSEEGTPVYGISDYMKYSEEMNYKTLR